MPPHHSIHSRRDGTLIVCDVTVIVAAVAAAMSPLAGLELSYLRDVFSAPIALSLPAVCCGMRTPRGHGRQRTASQRASKYDRSHDFTPDLRVSRIEFAPTSIRVRASRAVGDPIYGLAGRKPNCHTLLETFSHFVAAVRSSTIGISSFGILET